MSITKISNISVSEQILVEFFLFHPVLNKNCLEQPHGEMILEVYISVICILRPFERTSCKLTAHRICALLGILLQYLARLVLHQSDVFYHTSLASRDLP